MLHPSHSGIDVIEFNWLMRFRLVASPASQDIYVAANITTTGLSLFGVTSFGQIAFAKYLPFAHAEFESELEELTDVLSQKYLLCWHVNALKVTIFQARTATKQKQQRDIPLSSVSLFLKKQKFVNISSHFASNASVTSLLSGAMPEIVETARQMLLKYQLPAELLMTAAETLALRKISEHSSVASHAA